MIIKTVAVEDVIPYARNPRKNQDAISKVSASLKEYGWQQPIVVDAQMVVIAGHTRLEAAKRLKMKKVPIHIAENLTDAQVKAYRIADNRVAQEADWDIDLLKIELGDLDGLSFDLSLTGFDDDELNAMLAEIVEEGLVDDDEVPSAPENPISVLGDVWTLGNHRLMCGDSTSIDAVDKLMDGAKADMVFTDPPYGFNYTKKSDGTSIKNDGAEFEQVISDALSCVSVNTAYVCGDAKTAEAFLRATSSLGSPKNCIVWVKPIQHRMHRYEPCHEFIWYWGDNGSPFYGSNFFEAKREIKKFHPTIKPVELIEYCLASHQDKKIVVDFFGGSGSTLIACEKTGHHCRMMELDETYADIIICRWQDFTGKEATHEETGKTYNEMKADRDVGK